VHRRVRAAPGTVVELAFDSGRIVAGDAALPVCELEIELVSGGLPALLALARRWVPRHGLWLDPRTKAERGDALARGEPVPPAVHARALRLPADIGAAAGVRAMLAAAVDQALPNAGALAAGLGEPEHVHQLRVALRRLRTVLRLFGDVVSVPPTLTQALGDLFGRLGTARDRDVLAGGLLPRIAQAGGPPLELPAAEAADVGAVLRDPAVTLMWLDLLGLAHVVSPVPAADASGPAAGESAGPALRDIARPRLRALRKRCAREAGRFATMDDEARHALRRRLKRLRYGIDFTASLFPGRGVAREAQALRAAQDALGDFNDLCVAEALCRSMVPPCAGSWFALGWLAAQRPVVEARCVEQLAAWAQTTPFWKKG
jgi:inorganic triphosphatase YgiF